MLFACFSFYINSLTFIQHPYLHPIEHVEVYVHKDEQLKETHLLLMVQPFVHSGSLKDMIYKVNTTIPDHD